MTEGGEKEPCQYELFCLTGLFSLAPASGLVIPVTSCVSAPPLAFLPRALDCLPPKQTRQDARKLETLYQGKPYFTFEEMNKPCRLIALSALKSLDRDETWPDKEVQ